MPRIRSVHPGLFTDEAFMALSAHARVLWIGLWTEADDQGIFEWKPLTLKARILPADAIDIAALLAELATQKLVKAFDHAGRSYGAVRNFAKYQRPKKPNAIYPCPDELAEFLHRSPTSSPPLTPMQAEPVPHSSPTAGEESPQMEDGGWRMEDEGGKKKEQSASPEAPPAAGRASRLQIETLPDDWRAYCLGRRPDLDPAVTFERFRNHWISQPGARGRKLDWVATFHNWVLSERPPPKASLFDAPKPLTLEQADKLGRNDRH